MARKKERCVLLDIIMYGSVLHSCIDEGSLCSVLHRWEYSQQVKINDCYQPLGILCLHLEYFVLFWCLSVMEILKIRCRRPPAWWGSCSTQGARRSWEKWPLGPTVSREAKTVLGSDCSLQVPRGWLWKRPKQTLQDAQCEDEMTVARCSKRNSS